MNYSDFKSYFNLHLLLSCHYVSYLYHVTAAEREAVSAAERAERKLQLRDKVSSMYSVDDCLPSLAHMRSLRSRDLYCLGEHGT